MVGLWYVLHQWFWNDVTKSTVTKKFSSSKGWLWPTLIVCVCMLMYFFMDWQHPIQNLLRWPMASSHFKRLWSMCWGIWWSKQAKLWIFFYVDSGTGVCIVQFTSSIWTWLLWLWEILEVMAFVFWISFLRFGVLSLVAWMAMSFWLGQTNWHTIEVIDCGVLGSW